MNHRMRKAALYLGGALGIVAAVPAFAQSAEVVAGGSDIIVTARRQEERLQDVPISITVFSQQQISDRNIVTATDLGTYTPSLSVNQRFGPEKSSFALRGFVQENGTSASVGVYFADVVAPRVQGGTTSGNTAPTGSFMDLQNVQVLKGPQGTLFGRNTTGGAVLLVPHKPTDKLEGSVEGSAGNYDMWRLQGVLNVPLADTFKVRLAVDRNKRDGYMKNHSGIGPDSYNDLNYFAGRLSIVADLTPELENYTIATYSHSFSRGYGARLVACDRRFTPGFLVTNTAQISQAIMGSAACAQLDRQAARGDGPLDIEVDNANPYLDIHHWQVINTTTWQATDNIRIKNIVSYQEYRERASFSLNGDNFSVTNPAPRIAPGLPLPPQTAGAKFQYVLINPAPNNDLAAESTFTEELQIQGETPDGRFNWQVGGYLEMARPIGFNAAYSAGLLNCSVPEQLSTCTNPLGLGSMQNSATKFWYDNKGLYGQGTFKLTEQLSLTAGIRYTMDKVRALGQSTRIRLPSTRTCNDTVRFGNLVVQNAEQCAVIFRQSSNKPTWLIDLDYKPSDDILLYAKWARGYREGGINITNIGFEVWKPEQVDLYEVGAKTSFRGAVPGYFNVAAFYNDFRNQQIVANGISNVPGFNGSAPIVNAGKSRIQGIEADASATLFDALRFDLGYTYLDTKVKSISLPPIPAGAPYSALIPSASVGDPLPLSPKHRVTLTGTYALPVPESVGQVSLGATYVYTAKQAFTKATLPQYWDLPATNIVNLNVNWDNIMGQPVDASFFVTNLTNNISQVAVGTSYNSAGFESLLYAPPRMWGFRLKYRFSE
ncbi:MAG TPA: TonB-dependent receptor [Novosphingobium sp.]